MEQTLRHIFATLAVTALPFVGSAQSNDLWKNAGEAVVTHDPADCGLPSHLTQQDSGYLWPKASKAFAPAAPEADSLAPIIDYTVSASTDCPEGYIPEGYTWALNCSP